MARRVVAQASFSWPFGPIHLLAPYETAASLPKVRAEWASPIPGVAATPLHIAMAGGWQPQGGTTPLRAQRVLKGKGMIDKKGETAGVPLLARSAAAHTRRSGRPASNRRAAAALSESEAAFPPVMCGQFRTALQGEYARMARRGREARRNGAPSRRALRKLTVVQARDPSLRSG